MGEPKSPRPWPPRALAVRPLPPKLSKLFGKHFFCLKVLGDNSCFYHSILFLLSSEYRKYYNANDKKAQQKLCTEFRKNLCNNLTPETFKPFKGFTTITKMKKNLLDYNHWAGNIEWKYVCDQLKINLFMFRYDYDDIYQGWGYDNYNPENYTVCIMNFFGMHYDPIVFLKLLSGTPNEVHARVIKTKLDSSTQISKRIVRFYEGSNKALRESNTKTF